MKRLKHESDFGAKLGERVFIHGSDRLAVDANFTFDRLVEPGNKPSIVDFPLPEGPTTAMNWPSGIMRSSG